MHQIFEEGKLPNHPMGLAACEHKLKHYQEAITSYMHAFALDPSSPMPPYHASDCCLKQNDKPAALMLLIMTVNILEKNPKYSAMKARTELTLEALKNEIRNDFKAAAKK